MDMECLFFATTTPGLESVCEKELQKFAQVGTEIQCFTAGGLIFRASPFMDFLQLKSICSLNALVGTLDDISQADALERFLDYPLIESDLWTKAYHLKQYFDEKHGTSPPRPPPPPSSSSDSKDRDIDSDSDSDSNTHSEAAGGSGVSGVSDAELWSRWRDHDESALCTLFRVSCTRKKEEHFPAHAFTSLQAAGHLGYGIGKRYPNWTVDLKRAHVDVIFHIMDDKGVIAINLIQEKTISQRNRAPPLFPWITALAPPTAFSLCALLQPHVFPGMVICDPMCGIGTIPIEGALAFPQCFFVGGELSAESVQQARANEQWTRQHRGNTHHISSSSNNNNNSNNNSSALQPSFNVEIVQWNAGSIPVRSGSVDVIVCDMPFGMKHGSYRQNRKLYPVFFGEMLRILSEEGKVLLLTLEMKLVRKTLAAAASAAATAGVLDPPQSQGCHYLYEHSSLPVTIGGFKTKIFEIRKKKNLY